MALCDEKSKNIIVLYSFADISNWSTGDTYFHMTIGDFVDGKKLLFETPLGYKIDDLIVSYIEYLQGKTRNVRRSTSVDENAAL